ncbi:hypothetical protein IQ255_13545 [Pleurocapsales cyanobacterium LEGE 10410]|nr:hypothetical protein [Pleurocapsales cyanobacterium LEGE 10410]
MNKQHQTKFHWQKALGVLAVAMSIIGVAEPAMTTPAQSQDSFQLAQVGVRSRVVGPTPLNIRPRTHIPLPASNYHRSGYYRYPGRRNYIKYKHYNRYGRDRYHSHRRRNRGGVNVIINVPARRSYYRSGSYFRIINH